jgi:hypothetical protein
MVIRYMHRRDLYIMPDESLIYSEISPITEIIIKGTALASCNKKQRQKIRTRIDNLLRTETSYCMKCGFVELKGRNLVKTHVFSAAWDKFSQMIPYASPGICVNTKDCPNREVIYISSDDESDTDSENSRAKRVKTPRFLKFEEFGEQVGEVIEVQTRQHTPSSCNRETAQQVSPTSCRSYTTRGTRPSLVVKLKCNLPNELQVGCKTVATERRRDARIERNNSSHNRPIIEVKAVQATNKAFRSSSRLTSQDSLASRSLCMGSQMEASARPYSLTTPMDNYINNTINPEIRLSILQYQDGIPCLIDAIPIQDLPGIHFSSCTVLEFFAWYHKATNMPGDLSSLQALSFQYPRNLLLRRQARRIEAGDDVEFEDWREDLNEAVAETRRANEMGLLTKRLAATAGRFKIKVTESYISGMDGDVTSVLR